MSSRLILRHVKVKRLSFSEHGFALPSILFLVTILSIVAVSLVVLQNFLKKTALMEVAKVKAEYAAESGIARALHDLRNPQLIRDSVIKMYKLEDGGDSKVTIFPWGIYLCVSSRGTYRRLSFHRDAVIGDHPSSPFDNALVFANPSHQLVFTGQSAIQGSVIVGEPGVTIGNLQNYSSPVQIPINGKLERVQTPSLPPMKLEQLRNEVRRFSSMLSSMRPPDASFAILRNSSNTPVQLSSDLISDSLRYVFITGNLEITDSISRSSWPLYIIVDGKAVLKSSSNLQGLVGVASSHTITVESGAKINEALIYSSDSINVQAKSAVSCQFISPTISLQPGVQANYPTTIISVADDTTNQSVTLSAGVNVEGFVGLIASAEDPRSLRNITLSKNATVIGSIFTNSKITLDGTVIGSVMTRDFYFYDAPTTYLGWLRSGRIDRSKLPKGFLVPPGFSEESKFDVLDWL